MLAVFRNPLVRVCLQLWWIPLLIILVGALGFGAGFWVAMLALGACAAFGAGLVGSAWARSARASAQAQARHREQGHRFLCPDCLQFGGYHSACAECGSEVPGFVVHTGGDYVDTCGSCGAQVTDRPLPAFCHSCSAQSDAAVYHQRQVRVLGALTKADFDGIAAASGEPGRRVRGLTCLCSDDGQRLTYVLNLDDLGRVEAEVPASHAGRAVESIWTQETDPLSLGGAMDRFANGAGLDPGRLKGVILYAGTGSFPAAAERALLPRVATVKYGVSASDFLQAGAATREEKRQQ